MARAPLVLHLLACTVVCTASGPGVHARPHEAWPSSELLAAGGGGAQQQPGAAAAAETVIPCPCNGVAALLVNPCGTQLDPLPLSVPLALHAGQPVAEVHGTLRAQFASPCAAAAAHADAIERCANGGRPPTITPYPQRPTTPTPSSSRLLYFFLFRSLVVAEPENHKPRAL